MQISLIAAMSKNNVIGHHGKLPWHLPADLKHFKSLTLGKPLIMGRKTFESIGKPLPGRQTIIVTRNTTYQAAHCVVVHTLQEGLIHAQQTGANEVMIAGGGEIYRQAIDLATRCYLTIINFTTEGDTYFPSWDTTCWQEVERIDHPAQGDAPAYTFLTLDRT